ncbi:MAG TPA: TlpA disulfide reductase family protein [Gammaproteobacteria bacterium]
MARMIYFALLLCVVATAWPADAQTPVEVPVGDKLSDATLRGLNGPERNLSEFFGRPLIINVWASWCGPCRAEMASLERLAWLDESRDLTIIGISTDDYEDRAVEALTKSNATITHFIDANLQMEKMLGASRLPLTVFVAADGRVLRRVYGAREWDSPAALALIDSALRGRPEQPPAH